MSQRTRKLVLRLKSEMEKAFVSLTSHDMITSHDMTNTNLLHTRCKCKHKRWCYVSAQRWGKQLCLMASSLSTCHNDVILMWHTNCKQGRYSWGKHQAFVETQTSPIHTDLTRDDLILNDVVSHCDKHFVIWVRMLVPRVASYVCRCWGI